uniref:Uncharacterized protein n=1 Tax=Setaria viridis TaxID=4556 RepID=A0A4U6V0D6_SETVI|nr:hypothetical protein SEVIR_4G141300v2 [Setaria viridis]
MAGYLPPGFPFFPPPPPRWAWSPPPPRPSLQLTPPRSSDNSSASSGGIIAGVAISVGAFLLVVTFMCSLCQGYRNSRANAAADAAAAAAALAARPRAPPPALLPPVAWDDDNDEQRLRSRGGDRDTGGRWATRWPGRRDGGGRGGGGWDGASASGPRAVDGGWSGGTAEARMERSNTGRRRLATRDDNGGRARDRGEKVALTEVAMRTEAATRPRVEVASGDEVERARQRRIEAGRGDGRGGGLGAGEAVGQRDDGRGIGGRRRRRRPAREADGRRRSSWW